MSSIKSLFKPPYARRAETMWQDLVNWHVLLGNLIRLDKSRSDPENLTLWLGQILANFSSPKNIDAELCVTDLSYRNIVIRRSGAVINGIFTNCLSDKGLDYVESIGWKT